jgi:hypothetical protein
LNVFNVNNEIVNNNIVVNSKSNMFKEIKHLLL